MNVTITEATQTSFMSIEERKEEILGTITNLLKVMCKAVQEVKIVVDFPSATYETQAPSETSIMEKTTQPVPFPPISIQVSKTVVIFGTPESNHVFQDNDQIIIDFSSMHMNEVYAVPSVINA